MDPISRKPYGPAADKGCIERPDIRRYLTHMPLFLRSRACQLGGATYVHPVGARPETTVDAITTRNSRLLAADSPPNVRWHKPCREPAALQDPLTQNPLTEGARHALCLPSLVVPELTDAAPYRSARSYLTHTRQNVDLWTGSSVRP